MIGEVAAGADVSIDTVRFYERRGVLPVPERTDSGYRTHPPATVDRLVLARRLQSLGFTLDERIYAVGTCTTRAARPARRSGGGSTPSSLASTRKSKTCRTCEDRFARWRRDVTEATALSC